MGSLKHLDLLNLFHAHLMHTELVSGDVRGEVTFPPWIMREAREAWMRDILDDKMVSGDHRKVAAIIGELGVPHEVENLTAGAYDRPLLSST